MKGMQAYGYEVTSVDRKSFECEGIEDFSNLKDFVKLEADLNQLSTAQEYIINPNNPREQVVLPIHKVIHDKQAQKNDIATKILRSLDNEIAEDSPFIKAITAFEEKFSK